ncbi:MAG TPA: hypothetical protein VHS59_05530 [Bacillota bacterium]|nr:hypothetical protein [Bacillota bacterium]
MASPVDRMLETLIREEEALNHRYRQLAEQAETPAVTTAMKKYATQGYERIQQLYRLWKSVQETKP